jgi:hypothetical protein
MFVGGCLTVLSARLNREAVGTVQHPNRKHHPGVLESFEAAIVAVAMRWYTSRDCWRYLDAFVLDGWTQGSLE